MCRQVRRVERRGCGAAPGPVPGVRMGQSDEAAQVGVPDGGLGIQRDVGAAGERQLRAGDCTDARLVARMREGERPAQPVVVGQCDRLVPHDGGMFGELFRGGRPIQKTEGGVGVQFDVGLGHEHMFVDFVAVCNAHARRVIFLDLLKKHPRVCR